MPENQPRFIGSAAPFKAYAEKYFNMGWNPVPLPPGEKNPPPKGFSGHGRPMVTEGQLAKWFSGDNEMARLVDKEHKPYSIERANIALRLNNVEAEGILFEIVAIDVDHHPEEDGDAKNGGEQLALLEKKLGKLPKTWINSARTNGIAGQRFYLAPKGLQWKGKANIGAMRDVDVLSKNCRFAAVFPSAHPKGGQYWWYPPGFAPDGNIDAIDRNKYGFFPDPKKLPLLPKAWVDFLTNDRMPETVLPLDMDISERQLNSWASKNFAPRESPCEYMELTVKRWIDKLEDSNSSHGILTDAHYHLFKCGANEGHTGWLDVIKEFESVYISTVLARGKRSNYEAKKEVERSRYGALRRLKGEAEKHSKDTGQSFFSLDDPCEHVRDAAGPMAKTDGADSNWGKVPTLDAQDAPKYEMTDWGNAEHFRDLHEGNVFHIKNGAGGWLAWDGEKWLRHYNSGIARHLFRRVKRRQDQAAQNILIQANATTPPNANGLKAAALYKKFAQNSGNHGPIGRALDLAGQMEDMMIGQEELDADRYALGVANGLLKWAKHDDVMKGAVPLELITSDIKDRLITRNTGVPYIPYNTQADHSDPLIRKGFREFELFLHKVQPDKKMRDYLQKLLGQTLLGENQEKIAIFLYGPTNTGKTTMLELMLASVGRDYGMMQAATLYTPSRLNPALGQAIPMRIAGTDELGNNKIASDLFKTITGNATLTVEYKNSNQLFTDRAQFTPIISTNSPPIVPNEDDAFRGRIVTIPFEQNLKSRKGDREQSRLYEDGRIACLAWLVEGCTQAIADGIRPFPNEVQAATTDFTSKMSEIGEFIAECIVHDEDSKAFIRNTDIYQHYEEWAQRNGIDYQKRLNMAHLARKLSGHGFIVSKPKKIDGRVHKGFVGMKLIGTKIAEQIEGTKDE